MRLEQVESTSYYFESSRNKVLMSKVAFITELEEPGPIASLSVKSVAEATSMGGRMVLHLKARLPRKFQEGELLTPWILWNKRDLASRSTCLLGVCLTYLAHEPIPEPTLWLEGCNRLARSGSHSLSWSCGWGQTPPKSHESNMKEGVTLRDTYDTVRRRREDGYWSQK